MKNPHAFTASSPTAFAPISERQLNTLKHHLEGEIFEDLTHRWMYSTDASIYQMMPELVAVPKTPGDLSVLLDFAREHRLPLTPRGGGTSLGGQAIGQGIQVDFSKHLNQIIEIDTAAGFARVQPGVILAHFNQALAPHQHWFGPDVAPTNRATLGGMIGNNSAGARSILYGKTLDHVLGLETLWSDGRVSQVNALSPSEWKSLSQQPHCEGRLAAHLSRIQQIHAQDVEAAFPKILRRVSGYNLDAFITPNRPQNLAHLLVGSEGTLALWREARVRIVPRPQHSALLVLYFDNVGDALEANHAMLETEPSAAELIDDMLLELTRQNPGFTRKLHFMAYDAPVILLVQYLADSNPELEDKLQRGVKFARQQGISQRYSVATDERTQADIWAIRKAGMPLLYSMPGAHKPITFIEDTAVDPAQLKPFISEFNALIAAHDTRAAYYAHASVGCLHIRPLINLKSPQEVKKMRSLAEGVVQLVQKYHGAMSGEHGDGLARSEFNERLFGPVVYGLFQELKALADPDGLLNPGKIVNAPPMDHNLRYGEHYTPRTFQGVLKDATGKQSFNHLVEQCNGCGACRKDDLGSTMCPPFRATRQEQDSTRGRANSLRRLLLQPELMQDTNAHAELQEAMATCIGCKACKAECPSQVDMARLKSEFLHAEQAQKQVPLRKRLRNQLFGHIKWLNHLGALTAPLSNALVKQKHLRQGLEKLTGISSITPLPPFAAVPFDYRFAHHKRPESANTVNAQSLRPAVILFNDCYMNYNHPEVGEAAVKVIEALGYRVIVPEQTCCGRPQISLGLLPRARQSAQAVWQALAPYLAGSEPIPVLGVEPSCVLSFADEYPGFSDAQTQILSERLASQSTTLQAWLSKTLAQKHHRGETLPFHPLTQRVFFHEHCHQKALDGQRVPDILKHVSGLEVVLSQAGCCGMAGSFGYEAEHIMLSQQIAESQLLPQLTRAHDQRSFDQLLVSGMSCRHQIENQKPEVLKVPVRHWVELLADSLVAEQEQN